MLNLTKSVVFCIALCLVFSIIQVLFIYYFLGENANECLFTLINQQGYLSKKIQSNKKGATAFIPNNNNNNNNNINNNKNNMYKSVIIRKEVERPLVSESVLFVLILSSNQTSSRRKVVRDTWAAQSYGLEYNHAFALAQEEQDEDLLIEKDFYQDIIILDGVGGAYRQLTDKVLQAIIYCYNHFQYKYLLKTDDDSFVYVKGLLQQIDIIQQQYNYNNLILAGRPMRGTKILLKGRWADKQFKKQSNLEKYPPYMQGGGYLISWGVTEFLSEAERKYKLLRTISEDVNMGVWLFGLNVTLLDWSEMFQVQIPNPNSPVFKAKNYSIDICQKNPPNLVIHRTSQEQMVKYFKQLQRCSNL